jgi:hypothetical protein
VEKSNLPFFICFTSCDEVVAVGREGSSISISSARGQFLVWERKDYGTDRHG